jgi:8-oxo-dGTP pyrophosphatase MutT (NUDIX family)
LNAIRPAATVVLLRETAAGVETLLLRRHVQVQFASGMWVFPGGRVDDSDVAAANGDILAAAKKAAIRETREETGLDISASQLQLFAHWTTPAGEPKRYATSFFIAAIDTPIAISTDVVVDGGEIDDHRWLTAAQAIALHRAGQLNMMPPTFAVLHEINTCNSIAEIVAMYRARPLIEIHPRRIETPQGRVTLYPGDAGYETIDASIAGARHRMVQMKDGLHYLRDC